MFDLSREPQWSSDETLCARLLNNDVLFYENSSFEVSVNKCSPAKVAGFSLAPGPAPHHVLCYLPGQSGQPSFGRLFQYPRFDATQSLANKSFFQVCKFFDSFREKRSTELTCMGLNLGRLGREPHVAPTAMLNHVETHHKSS